MAGGNGSSSDQDKSNLDPKVPCVHWPLFPVSLRSPWLCQQGFLGPVFSCRSKDHFELSLCGCCLSLSPSPVGLTPCSLSGDWLKIGKLLARVVSARR